MLRLLPLCESGTIQVTEGQHDRRSMNAALTQTANLAPSLFGRMPTAYLERQHRPISPTAVSRSMDCLTASVRRFDGIRAVPGAKVVRDAAASLRCGPMQ
jgi:hypothetical protein